MGTTWGDFNANLVRDLREHGGRATGGPFKGRDVLILTTRGAKSGEERVNPVVYHRDGERLVIVASKGGAPTSPGWYHNLVANPTVTVEVLGKTIPVHASFADGEEYERLYKQHADINPGFWDYRKRTSRKIPVVVLDRVE